MEEVTPPLYAIVELLIRASTYNPRIGSYKDHYYAGRHIVVSTTTGRLTLSQELIIKQFVTPKELTPEELQKAATAFSGDE